MVTRGLASRWEWIVVLAFCLIPGFVLGDDLPTAKPEEVGVSSEKVEELSTFMQSLVDDGKIAGGVTMMARHGKVIHLKAVGMADREEKTPMRTDAIFRIASMTKPITSVAVMMLWEQGKLDLDDPVSKFIPEFKNPQVLVQSNPLEVRPAKQEITIRHLLTHTSGLGYNTTPVIGPIYNRFGISGGIFMAAFTAWLPFSTWYSITDTDLLVRSAFFRWRVPLEQITEVHPTHNPLSSPALSLDRLRVNYKRPSGRTWWVMISPKDKEQFLDDLAKAAGLEREEDQLVRRG